MPADLRTITDFEDLNTYLRDELNWPVEEYKLDQLTFENDADELGLKDEKAKNSRMATSAAPPAALRSAHRDLLFRVRAGHLARRLNLTKRRNNFRIFQALRA